MSEQQDGPKRPKVTNINTASTSILHNIFDSALVGPCFGDYSCTYNRQSGRIYISGRALLFYSNLFGFERRLCLLWNDMTSARAFRTTSIQVEMVDGEDFVFKSISADREIIVKLIQNLMKDARFRSRNGGSSKYSAASSSPTMPTLNGSVAQPVMLQPRLRAHSAPTDVAAAEEDSASGPALSASPQRVEVTPLPSRKASTETTDSSVMTDNNTEHAWTEAIGVAAYKDTIVNELALPISLDDFYSKFLGDGAEQSMPSYQKAVIGDTEIVCPSWIVDSSSHQQTLKRTISFRHPINSMGMGPSSATARRVQTLSRYGHYGLIMETTTHVEGIPAADCFHVVDRWLVESEGNDEVRWTVQIESIFTKKTMLKTIIEKSTKKEIKRWYNGFVELVQREAKGSARTPAEVIVAHTSPSNDLKLCSKSKEPASLFPEWFLATVVLCCILVCALVVVQSLQTQHSLAELQREVLLLRRDQDQMITVITELMQELKRQKQGEALEI